MTNPELLIARHIAEQAWPAIGPQTTVTVIPTPIKRTRLPITDKDYSVEIHSFLILPQQTQFLLGYSTTLDELIIIDEHPTMLGVRQGLLQIVDSLEKGMALNIRPTTSDLRKEERKRATA